MKKLIFPILAPMTLAACDGLPAIDFNPPWLANSASSPQSPQQTPPAALPAPDKVEVASLDPQPATPVTALGQLGTTVASLGDATKPGFWIETPLVTTPQKGKIRYGATGREVRVDLIPIAGPVSGGSFLSLGAMRLLNLPMTGLAEVEVFADGVS